MFASVAVPNRNTPAAASEEKRAVQMSNALRITMTILLSVNRSKLTACAHEIYILVKCIQGISVMEFIQDSASKMNEHRTDS
jgi:hypothetical protein